MWVSFRQSVQVKVPKTSKVVPPAIVKVPEVKESEVSERMNCRESNPSRVSASDPAVEAMVIVLAVSSGVIIMFDPARRSIFPSLFETPSREERMIGLLVKFTQFK